MPFTGLGAWYHCTPRGRWLQAQGLTDRGGATLGIGVAAVSNDGQSARGAEQSSPVRISEVCSSYTKAVHTHGFSSPLILLTTSSTSPSSITLMFFSGFIASATLTSSGKGALRRLLGSRPSCDSVSPVELMVEIWIGESGLFVMLEGFVSGHEFGHEVNEGAVLSRDMRLSAWQPGSHSLHSVRPSPDLLNAFP